MKNQIDNQPINFLKIVNNLPIDKLYIVKNENIWSNWLQSKVITCKNITVCSDEINDVETVVSIHIKDVESYIDCDLDLIDQDLDGYMLEDIIDGFYCFSNYEKALSFYNELKRNYLDNIE